MVSLGTFEEEALGPWIKRTVADYIEERSASGEDRQLARRRGEEAFAAFFPDGRPADGQLVSRILDEGTPAGTLWIGPIPEAPPTHWWVWSIEIDEPLRGRGLGRAAMLLAEDEARARGATQLGLNVFSHNAAALRLYETLGYAVTSQQMRKEL
jgi:ribosomal protein S18 acetylase RimI-like enzyme